VQTYAVAVMPQAADALRTVASDNRHHPGQHGREVVHREGLSAISADIDGCGRAVAPSFLRELALGPRRVSRNSTLVHPARAALDEETSMKLYSGPVSMFGAKAEIAVLEKGIDCPRELVPFSLATLYEPKHAVVARVNPKQQVPVLVDGDLELYDSTQIFEYLEDAHPEPPLWPREPRARARARLAELESDEVFFPNVVTLMPRQRVAAGDEGVAAALAAIEHFYAKTDASLAARDYLAESFSYADIAFFMAQFFASFLGAPPASELSNVAAWRSRVGARPSVKQVAGTMAQYLRDQGLSLPPL
jgi:glutathione S-transferase